MTRTVYVNGTYLPEDQATVSVFDRGFLMADGVYEVTSVLDGKLVDFDGHTRRLHRSLDELEMQAPCSDADLIQMHRELVRLNGIDQGMIYLQVTRGNPGDRSFVFPDGSVKPTIVAFTQDIPNLADAPAAKTGFKVISVPDIRWGRRDIKTVQLLYPSMAKMMAKKAGVDDSWMVEDGVVTEGASSTAFLVTENDEIITRPLSQAVLPGITRMAIIEVAKAMGLKLVERPFTVEEIMTAREAFYTSASTIAMPVVRVDGQQVGGGQPGPVVRALRARYLEAVMAQPREDGA
jgi:D-alanine transaminase